MMAGTPTRTQADGDDTAGSSSGASPPPGDNLSNGIIRRIFGNLGKLMGGKAVAGLLSLVYMIIAVRALGAHDYGVLILVHAYTIIVGGLIEFPGWHAVVRYGAQAIASGDRERLVRLLRLASFVELACGVIAVATAALLAPFFGARLGWSPTALAFAVPYSFAVLATIRSAPAGYLQLLGRFDLLGYHNLVAPTVRLLGASIAYGAGAGLRGFLITWLVAALAEWGSMWLMGWIVARRALPGHDLLGSARGAVRENPGIRRFMIAANADATFGELSQRIAPLMVGWVMGPAAAGLYAVGQRGAVVIAQPAGNLGQAAYAELARLIAAGGRGRDVRQVLMRIIAIAMAAAIPIVLLVAMFGTPLAVLIGGKPFAAAGVVMLWLVAARAVLLVAPPASAALVALGKPGLSVGGNMACALLLLPFLPLLMHRFGLSGAGFHALLTSSAIAIVLGGLAWRESGSVGSIKRDAAA